MALSRWSRSLTEKSPQPLHVVFACLVVTELIHWKRFNRSSESWCGDVDIVRCPLDAFYNTTIVTTVLLTRRIQEFSEPLEYSKPIIINYIDNIDENNPSGPRKSLP